MQVRRLEYRIEEIKRSKLNIERDMKGEFSSMNERLNGAYGQKTAILQHQMDNMQADLEKINELIRSVETSQDQVAFLKRSKEIRENMEVCIAKPLNPNLDVYPQDLPSELIEIRRQMENKPGLDQLLNLKNEIIFKLISNKPSAGGIDSTAQGELEEWARLTDKFASQLSRFKCMA